MKRLTDFLVRSKRRILLALVIMGPGLITAFADNDAAGVATYSVSAALFGYQMLFVLIPVTIVLAVTQEIGARIAIVTGQGLADIIRERYGVRLTMVLFTLLFTVNMAVVIQDISGMKAALELFHLPSAIYLPIIIGSILMFVVLANYTMIQRFFLVLIVFYVTYIASAVLAKPDWALAMRSLVIPSSPMNLSYIFTAVAVLGTTVTAWGQFFVNSYIKDKHITVDHLRYTRWEIYISAILTDVFSFFMMVAVAATLFVNHIRIEDAAQASLAIQPFAGQFAGLLFGVGLLIAGILGAIIVPLSTAYVFSEFFGVSGSLDEHFHKSRNFYVLFFAQVILATLIVLIPSVNLFTITLTANFINGLILPIIFFFLYKVANNRHIMGAYKNTHLQNILLVGAGIVISIASVIGGIGQLFHW